MRKFKVTVEISKTYEVEVDDNVLTEEELEGWESVFYDLDLTDDKVGSYVAAYCEQRADKGNVFIEGFGRVLKKDEKCPSYINESEVSDCMRMIKADDGGYVDIEIKELESSK